MPPDLDTIMTHSLIHAYFECPAPPQDFHKDGARQPGRPIEAALQAHLDVDAITRAGTTMHQGNGQMFDPEESIHRTQTPHTPTEGAQIGSITSAGLGHQDHPRFGMPLLTVVVQASQGSPHATPL